MPPEPSAKATDAQKKLLARIVATKKSSDAAKKEANLAKLDFRNAKKLFKDARRTAKKLRKEFKLLKSELAAFSAENNRRGTTRRLPGEKPANRAPSMSTSRASQIVSPITGMTPPPFEREKVTEPVVESSVPRPPA